MQSQDKSYIESLFGLEGKVAVVTGGGQGIGFMISTALIKAGMKVYIASRKQKVLDEAAAELNALGFGLCIPIQADLATFDGCKNLAQTLKQTESKVHLLVNNAGATWGAPMEKYPDSAWDKVINLNVKSIFNFSVQMLPLLRASGTRECPARVVNIGSINGLTVPRMETYAYSASKAAVHHLSKHMALRMASDNITVNAIACGSFPSHMMRETLKTGGEVIVKNTPLKRIGNEQDVGGTVIYLASMAGSWVTGPRMI